MREREVRSVSPPKNSRARTGMTATRPVLTQRMSTWLIESLAISMKLLLA